MLSLASTADVLAALGSARTISFSGYMLHPGRLFDALDAAARRGARVEVRVEASPYRAGSLGRLNARMVERLARDGADARVGDGIHTKALTADGVAFYDDCNWLDRGGDTVVRDDASRDPAVATTKGDAVAQEVGLLASARNGDAIDVETESFGNGPVSGALARAARAGVHVRVLVSKRELRRNAHEAATIASLERAGVEIRKTDANEKFAVVDSRTWVGSANASYGAVDQSDWGAVTADAAIRGHCESAFEARFPTSSRAQ
jgi:phosphatidylserine/phosphatidylglycerophosphate/cardiolipin synthase-like enzyme